MVEINPQVQQEYMWQTEWHRGVLRLGPGSLKKRKIVDHRDLFLGQRE